MLASTRAFKYPGLTLVHCIGDEGDTYGWDHNSGRESFGSYVLRGYTKTVEHHDLGQTRDVCGYTDRIGLTAKRADQDGRCTATVAEGGCEFICFMRSGKKRDGDPPVTLRHAVVDGEDHLPIGLGLAVVDGEVVCEGITYGQCGYIEQSETESRLIVSRAPADVVLVEGLRP